MIKTLALDSDYKEDKGCRGIGRLMWLKAFNAVKIESIFKNENNQFFKRSFQFTATKGVHNELLEPVVSQKTGTKIELIELKESYRNHFSVGIDTIAKHRLEHCLLYFIRLGSAPKIIVHDDEGSISLEKLYTELMHANSLTQTVNIKTYKFELIHFKFCGTATNKKHQLALCASNRLVKEKSIQGKILGLYDKHCDNNGEFIYTCYISSPYLDDHVRAERTSFDIGEVSGELLSDQELNLKEIRETILNAVKSYLAPILSENIKASKESINNYVSKDAPRYRSIVQFMTDDELIIDPNAPKKEMELHLHKKLYEVEQQLIDEGHKILEPTTNEHIQDYQLRVQRYMQKAEALKYSDLADYVAHRKITLELLKKSISEIKKNNYFYEEVIHKLIMPMNTDTDNVSLEACNLWLVDEKLAFHNYLASNVPFKSMPITESNSGDKPDLLGLNVYDEPILINNAEDFPLASITIVELKRPMRDDMSEKEKKNPITQCLEYLETIRNGKATTKNGRLIPESQHIPGYCYVLCDLTPTMENCCKNSSLTKTADGMGYFGFNNAYNAYIEVISFNQMVKAAQERNQAFFDKLGLPTT